MPSQRMFVQGTVLPNLLVLHFRGLDDFIEGGMKACPFREVRVRRR